MEFDKSKVYTALNADELKAGSKVVVADSLSVLKSNVESNVFRILDYVDDEIYPSRFVVDNNNFLLAYLISEPEDWNRLVCRLHTFL